MPVPHPIRPLTAFAVFLFAATGLFGATFAAALDEDGVQFERKSEATFRWGVLFRVFDGALFTAPGDEVARALAGEAPLRLELHYRRAFSAEDIVRGGDALLRKNLDADALARIESRLERINAAYRGISPGDRYSLTFVPGKGTTLRLNGDPLATVEGADFAAAYFRIWLGEEPISPAFRDELLHL